MLMIPWYPSEGASLELKALKCSLSICYGIKLFYLLIEKSCLLLRPYTEMWFPDSNWKKTKTKTRVLVKKSNLWPSVTSSDLGTTELFLVEGGATILFYC